MTPEGYMEIPTDEIMEIPGCEVMKAYYRRGLKVVVSRDNDLWHVSISHKNRYPSWDEIHEARYGFVPDDCYMAMILPPKREYVNLHPNCFHLHELRKGEMYGRTSHD